MKLRYILLIGFVGLLDVYVFRSSMDMHLIVLGFGCCVLYALRCIEYQIGDLKGRLHAPSAATADPIDDWMQLRDGSWVRLAGAFHPYVPRLVREVEMPTHPNDRPRQVESVRLVPDEVIMRQP